MRRLATARPLVTVFTVALVARVAVGVAVFVAFDGVLFGDDATYANLAADMVAGDTSGWDPYTRWLYWSTAAFSLPLTAVYAVFGAGSVAGHVLVAVLGALAAVLVTRLAMEILPVAWALATGLVVALLPSQVLWSSLILKDAAVWAAVAGFAVALAVALRTRGAVLAWSGVAAVALTVLVAYLRAHTFVVVVWAAALAVWLGARGDRLLRGGVATVLAVALPWLLGLGPLGLGFVADAGSLEVRRAQNAANAETAIVAAPDEPGADGAGTDGDGVDGDGADGDGTDGDGADGDGANGTDGEDGEDDVEGLASDVTHLPTGLSVMLLEPYPWARSDNPRVEFARAESFLWWPLLAFALVGAGGVWHHRRVLAFPVLAAGGIAVMYALAEGNFGTAYRHRGEFVWVVALLAVYGAWRLAGRWRRTPPPPTSVGTTAASPGDRGRG